jgi:hypothetical protein
MLEPYRFTLPPPSLWLLAISAGITVVLARVRGRRRLRSGELAAADGGTAQLDGAAGLDEALDVEPPSPPRRKVRPAPAEVFPRRVDLEHAEPAQPGEDAEDLNLMLAGELGDAGDVESGDAVRPLRLVEEDDDADGLDRPRHRSPRVRTGDEPAQVHLEDEADGVE